MVHPFKRTLSSKQQLAGHIVTHLCVQIENELAKTFNKATYFLFCAPTAIIPIKIYSIKIIPIIMLP
jgi:hypothetical protein